MRIVTREEIGLDPVVRNSNGSPRPLVVTPVVYVTYHWTGVNVRFGDIGDTNAEIRAIEQYASHAGKPNEYNWVFHQDPDELIHEYASGYRAAHSAGENSIAYGYLLLNGIQEPINLHQVLKLQWMNDLLRVLGGRDNRTQDRGHRQMSGAATSCPGDDAMSKLEHFSKPFVITQPPKPPPKPEPKPPVPVDPPDSPKHGYYLVTDRKTPWSISAECYGTGTRWPEIAEANLPDEVPNPGERWVVPGFDGVWTEVRTGEGPWQILNRVFGSDGWNKSTGVDQFWQWNGGDPRFNGRIFNGKRRDLQPGERVWIRS